MAALRGRWVIMAMQPKKEEVERAPVAVGAEEKIVRGLETALPNQKLEEVRMKRVIWGVYVFLIVLGVGTGYLLSRVQGGELSSGEKPSFVKTDKVVGSTDEKTFRDSAVGVIEKDGIDGEGTHKLIREGGPSQTAYLISSVIDLDEYIGKKVKAWGETVAAKKAAWLMDVGKIELQ